MAMPTIHTRQAQHQLLELYKRKAQMRKITELITGKPVMSNKVHWRIDWTNFSSIGLTSPSMVEVCMTLEDEIKNLSIYPVINREHRGGTTKRGATKWKRN